MTEMAAALAAAVAAAHPEAAVHQAVEEPAGKSRKMNEDGE